MPTPPDAPPPATTEDAPEPDAATTQPIAIPAPAPEAAPRSGSRTGLVLVVLLMVLLLLVTGGGLLFGRQWSAGQAASGTAPSGAAQPGAVPGDGTAAPGGTPAEPAAPSDPLAAFTDPVLRAAAEPYVRVPGSSCERQEEFLDMVLTEQVVCRIGDQGASGIFVRYYDPVSVTRLRELQGNPENDPTAVPGTRRELRWEYVPGRPGVRAGIPAGTGRDGEGAGTRVRWLGLDPAVPLLYFDEEATGVSGQLALLNGGDPEQLRLLWADPTG